MVAALSPSPSSTSADANRAIAAQRDYYARTAARYDELHGHEEDGHQLARAMLAAVISNFGFRSLLDVGAGTGATLSYLRHHSPGTELHGVEPVAELRHVAYQKSISETDLTEGDGTRLRFGDASIDIVCEFAVLHHVSNPTSMIAEMLRVARHAIFISDCNNFGQGSGASRFAKQLLNSLKLWRLTNFIKTRGTGFTMSAGDGLAYSYSVFNDYRYIETQCREVHIVSLAGDGRNAYRRCGHVALLGLKR